MHFEPLSILRSRPETRPLRFKHLHIWLVRSEFPNTLIPELVLPNVYTQVIALFPVPHVLNVHVK